MDSRRRCPWHRIVAVALAARARGDLWSAVLSAPDAYSIRAYTPGDEAAIQRAFQEVFAVERSLAEWRWKFLEPPRGSRILLAFDSGGELVCQYAAIAVDVLWGGVPMGAAQIVDVFSRRRRGLGRRGGAFQLTMEQFLAECAAVGSGVAFVYGFPGDRHQRAGSVTGHYFAPDTVERLSRRSPFPAPAGRWSRAQSWISEGFDAHATDRLWQRSRHRYARATVRDAAWFRWRYEQRPGGRYLQLGVRRAGEIHAWGVADLSGGATLRWVDLLWDGERNSDLIDLAAELERRAAAQEEGGGAVELWLRGDEPARAALGERGYAALPEPHLRLSAITFAPQVSVPQVLTGFYLTMGDCDHF